MPFCAYQSNGRRLWCIAICSRLCCPVMLLPVPCLTSQCFVFFKIPCKLAKKMKKFVERRCRKTLQPTMEDVKEERCSGNGFAFEEGSSRSNCFDDIEGMLQELLMNNGFLFGSFWRHEDSSDIFDFK